MLGATDVTAVTLISRYFNRYSNSKHQKSFCVFKGECDIGDVSNQINDMFSHMPCQAGCGQFKRDQAVAFLGPVSSLLPVLLPISSSRAGCAPSPNQTLTVGLGCSSLVACFVLILFSGETVENQVLSNSDFQM